MVAPDPLKDTVPDDPHTSVGVVVRVVLGANCRLITRVIGKQAPFGCMDIL